LAAVDHEDPLAGAQQAVTDRTLQTLSERQQQHDRERSPGHREEGEERARTLRLQVADEVLEQDEEHASFSARPPDRAPPRVWPASGRPRTRPSPGGPASPPGRSGRWSAPRRSPGSGSYRAPRRRTQRAGG